MQDTEELALAEFRKGDRLIRLSRKSFKGTTFFDLRAFYKDAETGEWRHTRQGVSLNPAKEDVRMLIEKLYHEMNKMNQVNTPRNENRASKHSQEQRRNS